jgi:hypothetical protein
MFGKTSPCLRMLGCEKGVGCPIIRLLKFLLAEKGIRDRHPTKTDLTLRKLPYVVVRSAITANASVTLIDLQ